MKKEIIKMENGRVRVRTINDMPSMAQQQFKDRQDVNKIVAKYKKSGEWPGFGKKGVYADVSTITDYQSSMEKVLRAQEAFGSLPAAIRQRFGNDPAQLLAFLQDPSKIEEGIKLGIYDQKDMAPPKRDDSNDAMKGAKSSTGPDSSKTGSTTPAS